MSAWKELKPGFASMAAAAGLNRMQARLLRRDIARLPGSAELRDLGFEAAGQAAVVPEEASRRLSRSGSLFLALDRELERAGLERGLSAQPALRQTLLDSLPSAFAAWRTGVSGPVCGHLSGAEALRRAGLASLGDLVPEFEARAAAAGFRLKPKFAEAVRLRAAALREAPPKASGTASAAPKRSGGPGRQDAWTAAGASLESMLARNDAAKNMPDVYAGIAKAGECSLAAGAGSLGMACALSLACAAGLAYGGVQAARAPSLWLARDEDMPLVLAGFRRQLARASMDRPPACVRFYASEEAFRRAAAETGFCLAVVQADGAAWNALRGFARTWGAHVMAWTEAPAPSSFGPDGAPDAVLEIRNGRIEGRRPRGGLPG